MDSFIPRIYLEIFLLLIALFWVCTGMASYWFMHETHDRHRSVGLCLLSPLLGAIMLWYVLSAIKRREL